MAFPPAQDESAQADDSATSESPKQSSGSSDVSSMLDEVSSSVDELAQLFDTSDAVSDKDKGRLQAIQDQLTDLKESLSMGAGEDPSDNEAQPAQVGRMSQEAGNKDVKPVY